MLVMTGPRSEFLLRITNVAFARRRDEPVSTGWGDETLEDTDGAGGPGTAIGLRSTDATE